MNLRMQQPLSYPLYINRPRLSFARPWSSASFHLPTPRLGRFPAPFHFSRPISQLTFSQQPKLHSGTIASSPSYFNRHFRHLKESAGYPNRRSLRGPFDTSKIQRFSHRNRNATHAYQYQPSQTKSITDFEQKSLSNLTHLSKAHSWHEANHGRSNLSVAYAHELNLSPKRRRKHSSQKNKMSHSLSQKHLASTRKRNPSMSRRKRRPKPILETGIVHISTLDEMPINTTQTNKKCNSINKDRLSMKGSISNSSTRRQLSMDNRSAKNGSIKNNENRIEPDIESLLTQMSSSSSPSSSSSLNSTFSLLQERLNGSLRNDPLITAAMEDFRQFRRSSSQNISITARTRNLSHDSLSSDSTLRSSRRSRSRSHSQSSFTSVERSEIREIIKKIKTKDASPLNDSSSLTSISIHVPTPETPGITYAQPLPRINKPKKSCITEELDREFNKLRTRDPDQELTYVTPSLICKRKKTLEKLPSDIPPAPTFDELLRQVQLRPIDTSTKPLPSFKENSIDHDYKHSLLSVPVPVSVPTPAPAPAPVAVPRSSPMPTPRIYIEPTKHEYATPIKKTEEKSLLKISHFQPMRNLTIHKPTPKVAPKAPALPPPLPVNLPQYDLTNSIPTTFQPRSVINNQNEHPTTTAKENIYAVDIDVCIPSSTKEKTDDDILQTHLDNHTILTDALYTEFGTKQTVITSSLADDFALLLKRKHKHENKFTKRTERCSIL